MRAKAALLTSVRSLHIYLSVLGLAMMFFFAATGFVMNHEEWFGNDEPRALAISVAMPTEMLKEPQRDAIVQKLQREFSIRGILNDFQVEDDSIFVTFNAPGRQARVSIGRLDGKTDIALESSGFVGWITDLHKGANTGDAWKRIIDVVAISLAFSALSGLVLWLSLPKRRWLGISALITSLVLIGLTYFFLVP